LAFERWCLQVKEVSSGYLSMWPTQN
jgi:hypothetical protein